MQIVIEIDEARFKDIQRIVEVQIESNRFQTAEQIIANGIPLPKGHGRLIDAEDLKNILLHNFRANDKYFVPYSDRKGYRLRDREVDESIINAPTIIEADKEEE